MSIFTVGDDLIFCFLQDDVSHGGMSAYLFLNLSASKLLHLQNSRVLLIASYILATSGTLNFSNASGE